MTAHHLQRTLGDAGRRARGALQRSRLHWLADTRVAQWLAWRSTSAMTADRVWTVLEALDGAGIRCWLMGGWGVDALVGHQTRRHADLDLVIPRDQAGALVPALAPLGYELAGEIPIVGVPPLEVELKLRDGAGHKVEVMPLDVGELERLAGAAFGTGLLAERPVPCLSAASQRLLHSGYEQRARDRRDVALLAGGDGAR